MSTPSARQHAVQGASSIMKYLAGRCSDPNSFGSSSISIYDTAWLAMLRDPTDPTRWLFPESYTYLLLHQAEDGMWPAYASPIDGILNTLASLLALVKHHRSDTTEIHNPRPNETWEIPKRIEKAHSALQLALGDLDVNQTLHFECAILVPSLLMQLSAEKVVFEFNGRSTLTALYQKSVSELYPDRLPSTPPIALLRSLEGFMGVFDFGLISHHCSAEGGMSGSPASTVAYLLHSSQWDIRAQTYLENIVSSYGSCGGVPGGFPTPVSEISWTVSALCASNFNIQDFQHDDLDVVIEFLRNAINNQDDVHSFAPTRLLDVDDTANSLLVLELLGVPINRAPLLRKIEGSSHFKIDELERYSSTSTNCSVLLALLESSDVGKYVGHVEKTVKVLCSSWDANRLQDGRNLATEHTYMLLTVAFHRLLSAYDHASLGGLTENVIKVDVPVILVQLLGRTLGKQQDNGSWEDSVERTSYGVLLISYALNLPWPLSIRQRAEAAFRRAKTYLEAHSDDLSGEYLWIGKVTYKSPTLAKAYYLAATTASINEQSWTPEVREIFEINDFKMNKMAKFFGRLPLLRGLSEATMTFALYEAAMCSRRLNQARLDVFPRDDMAMSADKYLEYIPIAWTTINAANGFALSGDEMREMMILSMLNYQVDEYMESVVAHLTQPSSQILRMTISREVRNGKPEPNNTYLSSHAATLPSATLSPPQSDDGLPAKPPVIEDIGEVLSAYIRHVKQHPALLRSPETAQIRVMQELEKFLLAQMTHNADNARLREHRQDGVRASVAQHDQVPYYDWVRTTGANDTSCPYSFAFFCCLISVSGSHCLKTMEQKYLAREICLHLATMCRQYNDYGSAARDDAEGNLNSLHFPEFADRDEQSSSWQTKIEDGHREDSLEKAKTLLMKVAGIERTLMQVCWEALSPSLHKETRTKLKTFIDITDLFGQIYVARDIASRAQR